MIAVRRVLAAAAIGATLALLGDLYGSPRLAVALLSAVILLIAVALIAIANIVEPRP